jgi:class 3 adenylate cyclase
MHPTFSCALSTPIQANVLVALCDCTRFMQSARGRSSAELFADLNDFYLIVDDAVGTAGGLVVKFMGDAALVVFPEELADRGIMTLLDLKANVDRWLQDRPIGNSLHVNVHFGEVTIGRMGRAGHLDVIGETVNVAATLGSLGFGLSQQAFRCLSPEHRRSFRRFTPPVLYLPDRPSPTSASRT